MGTEDYSWLKRRRPKRKKASGRKPPPPSSRKTGWTRAETRRANKVKDAVIIADEVSKEFYEYRGLRFGHLPMFRSKVSNPKSRQHRPLDREILKRMAKIVKDGGHIALAAHDRRVVLNCKGGKASPKVPSTRRPVAKSTRKAMSRYLSPIARACIKNTVIKGREVQQVSLPAWDHASVVLKFLSYGAAIPKESCLTFSLHLHKDVFEAGMKSKKGVASYLQDRVYRSLKGELKGMADFVPDFAMIIEGYRGLEAFHVHGVFDVSWRGSGLRPRGLDLEDTFHRALVRAAGKIAVWEDVAFYRASTIPFVLPESAKKEATARQLTVRILTNLPGWIDYCTKHMLTTAEQMKFVRRRLGHPDQTKAETLVVATDNIRKRGKQWYVQARKKGNVQIW